MAFTETQYLIDGVFYKIIETADIHEKIRNGKLNDHTVSNWCNEYANNHLLPKI